MSSSLLAGIAAGSRITAAQIQGVAPLAVVKGADQDVTSSTTLQDDNALLMAVEADTTYLWDCYLNYEGAASGGDMKFNWSVPGGVVTFVYTVGFDNPSAAWAGGTTFTAASSAIECNTVGTGDLSAVTMTGVLITGATAGTMQLEWAQNSSSSTPTIVHAGSYLRMWGGS